MLKHTGLLLLGALLVGAGFVLARTPSWLAPAQADVAAIAAGVTVTTDDANPGRIYVWQFNGAQLTSVTVHQDNGEGNVNSRELRIVNVPRVR